jgi:hypothetical protein
MILRLALIAMLTTALPALALGADGAAVRRAPQHRDRPSYALVGPSPYPLSRRAAKIRLAERCWRACQSDAGRAFQACLRQHWENACVRRNAAADRYCLRACRIGGGPWVTVEE